LQAYEGTNPSFPGAKVVQLGVAEVVAVEEALEVTRVEVIELDLALVGRVYVESSNSSGYTSIDKQIEVQAGCLHGERKNAKLYNTSEVVDNSVSSTSSTQGLLRKALNLLLESHAA
jgi:hypothetical protein